MVSMARAVGSAIRATRAERLDAGTVALARQYAVLIDNAAPAAKYRKHLDGLRTALDLLEPEECADALEHLDAVAVALAEHSVASDLGPKLLAALTALGLTPAARKAAMGGQDGAAHGSTADELRQRRADRAARAR